MPLYDLQLTDERSAKLEDIAKERGITVDRLVNEIVMNHLVDSNKITRFVAKKGPRK